MGKLETMLAAYDFPHIETISLFARLLSIPLPEIVVAPSLTPSLTPAQEMEQTLADLVAWLMEESEQRPVLRIWEDLHCADPSSLELIHLLLGQLPTMRAMVLLTARPEFQPIWNTRSHISALTLARLGERHTEAICHQITGGRKLPPEVLAEIVPRTDGVLLFVEELTKTVLEAGVLCEVNGVYELAKPLSSVSIPNTLKDLLTARPDQLGPAKTIAQIASVIGRDVDYSLLLTVAGQDEETLKRHLSQLVASELL
jgi:predicted ATPase